MSRTDQPDGRTRSRTERRLSFWPRSRRWRLVLALALPAAAAVLAAFLVLPSFEPGRRPAEEARFRGGNSAVRPLSPVAETAARPPRFTWSRVPAAARYRFELYDGSMRRIYQKATAETTLVLTGPATESPARFWRVVPLTQAGKDLPAPPPTPFLLPSP